MLLHYFYNVPIFLTLRCGLFLQPQEVICIYRFKILTVHNYAYKYMHRHVLDDKLPII